MSTPPEHVVGLRDQLVIERELIDERIRILDELLSTYGTPALVVPAKPALVEQHRCVDCSRTFPTPNGLAIHRGRSHPSSAAKPLGPLTSSPVLPEVSGPLVPEPIGKRPFNADAARIAAADAA